MGRERQEKDGRKEGRDVTEMESLFGEWAEKSRELRRRAEG